MREDAERPPVASRERPQSFAAYRLPPGKHGIPPEQVVENQRWRLLGAAAEVLAERGYVRIRTADVCQRAGVSRAALYEHFGDLGDCLLAACEMTVDCVLDLAAGACEAPATKGDRLKSALDGVLNFLAEEPALAHLLGPEAAAGLPAIAAARERLIGQLTGSGVDRYGLEGVLALVSAQVAAGGATGLPALADQVAELIELPVRGGADFEQ